MYSNTQLTHRKQAPLLTHYDTNDQHEYAMHDVLEVGDVAPDGTHYSEEAAHNKAMDDLAAALAKTQKVTINGVEHYLCWYGAPDRYGARPARLRPVDCPF